MPAHTKYLIHKILIFASVLTFSLAIYKTDGNAHKDLVILGLMLFVISELFEESARK